LNQKTKKLKLSKIGTVKVHLSRPIEGQIKTCTIKREADGWYVIFAVEEEAKEIQPTTNEVIGADMGLNSFVVLSNGEKIENPRFLRKSEADLKKAQRRVSRRRKGSQRRKKAIQLLAKRHQDVARQRRDFHFKAARRIIRYSPFIKFERLNVKGMVQNRHLAKSISDAGWSQFISIVEHKAEEAGGRVDKVNSAYTSQSCSRCGHRHKIGLQIRTYRCSKCGLVVCRDVNGAINISKGRAVPSWRRKDASFDERVQPRYV
jgi:putative transposase